jgi:hypothetical protein
VPSILAAGRRVVNIHIFVCLDPRLRSPNPRKYQKNIAMVNYYILAVAGLAANINALPLNINLGAYSPALVVGDGEISFGGRQDVSALMNVLEGAAVNAAAGVAQAPAQAPALAPQVPPAQVIPGAPAENAQLQDQVRQLQ